MFGLQFTPFWTTGAAAGGTTHQAAAVLTGAAQVTAAAAVTHPAKAVLQGAAQVVAVGNLTVGARASLQGAALVNAAGSVITTHLASAQLVGAALVVASATVTSPSAPAASFGSAGWATFTGRRIRQAIRHLVRRLPRRAADLLAEYLEEWWQELLALFRRVTPRAQPPALPVGKQEPTAPAPDWDAVARSLPSITLRPEPPAPTEITKAPIGTPIDVELVPWEPASITQDREAVERLLASLAPPAPSPVQKTTRVLPRTLVRRELLIRERRLLVAVRKLLAEIRRTLDAAEFRGAAVFGQLHPNQLAALERVWQRHVNEMVRALAAPVRKQEEEPLGRVTPEDLAARQIGDLIRELGPSQLIAVRRQLADLMEIGPRPEILQAISQATGLTARQAHAVSTFLQGQLARGASRMAAARAAQKYADRLLDLRARTIARHEAVTFTNQLVLERGRAVGGAGARMTKQWVSSRDERVDGGDPLGVCRLLDNNERIPIDQEFVADGESFDGPPAHIGCRCLVEIWRED